MSKPCTICVIDDDTIYQFIIKRIIQSQSITQKVLVFSEGSQALGFLKENSANKERLPDIILLDLNMPTMNGWSFLDEFIKMKDSLGKDIAIYVASSSINPDDIARARGIKNVSDYLIKPINPEQLKEIIESHS